MRHTFPAEGVRFITGYTPGGQPIFLAGGVRLHAYTDASTSVEVALLNADGSGRTLASIASGEGGTIPPFIGPDGYDVLYLRQAGAMSNARQAVYAASSDRLNSERPATYGETLSPTAGVTTSTFLPNVASITVTVGSLPLVVEGYCNGVAPSGAAVTSRLWVYDEAFAVVAFASFVSAGATDVRVLSPKAQKSYPVGTVKTFSLAASTSGGSSTYGQGAAGSLGPAYWLRISPGN